MISRRSILRGLFAAPVVIAAANLMPLRGIKHDPIVRLQSWAFGTEAHGHWWSHEGPLSRASRIDSAMRETMGSCFWKTIGGSPKVNSSSIGVRPTKEDMDEHHRMSASIRSPGDLEEYIQRMSNRPIVNGFVVPDDSPYWESYVDGYLDHTETLVKKVIAAHTVGPLPDKYKNLMA